MTDKEKLLQIEKICKIDLGAIPESSGYAEGWNEYRHKNYELLKKPILDIIESQQR